MGRPPGSKNSDYEQKRKALARRVIRALVEAPASHASLRELARAARVSVSTMRHYFEDRGGIVEAALTEMGQTAERHLRDTTAQAQAVGTEHRARLNAYVQTLARTWTTHRVGRAHAVGLAEGLYDPTGPAYVQSLLEPFVRSAEEMLASLHHPRLQSAEQIRQAALALLSPVLMTLVHQDSLGGASQRPLDVPQFLDRHVEAFEKGWLRAA